MKVRLALVVDDNELNVELATFLLEADGWTVTTAADGPAALAQVAHARPDLILMDIQLPGMDGLALTRRLKSDPATSSIPIIAFTAYAMKGDEQRMRAAGCDGYISKPIDVASFGARVRDVIAGRDATR